MANQFPNIRLEHTIADISTQYLTAFVKHHRGTRPHTEFLDALEIVRYECMCPATVQLNFESVFCDALSGRNFKEFRHAGHIDRSLKEGPTNGSIQQRCSDAFLFTVEQPRGGNQQVCGQRRNRNVPAPDVGTQTSHDRNRRRLHGHDPHRHPPRHAPPIAASILVCTSPNTLKYRKSNSTSCGNFDCNSVTRI